eukprot:TRINITY_DN597_c0_g2_i1.p2 TRINITY_DN597_c0_g2~~TRINITY_DN597_c0_g2_i1.p2  ORF type:complete len:155 (+),score=49.77 TRINITY_DN597_c0_g2_i1:45-509(+)
MDSTTPLWQQVKKREEELIQQIINLRNQIVKTDQEIADYESKVGILPGAAIPTLNLNEVTSLDNNDSGSLSLLQKSPASTLLSPNKIDSLRNYGAILKVNFFFPNDTVEIINEEGEEFPPFPIEPDTPMIYSTSLLRLIERITLVATGLYVIFI